MTLDQLRYFQAVCQQGSVSRASQVLNISQPSVSSAIGKLEKEFGITLFTRQSKRLALTKEGAVLLELANDLLSRTENMIKTMDGLNANKVLILGVPPMLSSLILPVLYSNFFNNHPDFKINIIEDDRSGLIRMLEKDEINMAFLPHDKPLDNRFHAKHLIELDNVCCISKKHKLATKKSISIQDLQTENLVLFKNSFFQTERILEQFKQLGFTPKVLLDTAQVSTVKSIASKGLAVGIVFDFLLNTTPELIGIPFDPPMHTQVSLVWKKGEFLSANMNHFINFIDNHAFFE